MEIIISFIAISVLLWFIIKPFMLLIIEQENERYKKENKKDKE
jgi:flagellar biosynthesis/type III secretory pathway M-ring protein FliF/YscJ